MTSPSRRAARRGRERRPEAPAASDAAVVKTFKIGEAAGLIGVKAYVLRFWETQFSLLRPSHTQSRHRVYREKDIQILRLIKRLLHDERFTIEGARKRLKELGLPDACAKPLSAAAEGQHREPAASDKVDSKIRRTLAEIRLDLVSLHKLLRG